MSNLYFGSYGCEGAGLSVSAHPETIVFGLSLSAIIYRLSAKGIKNKFLADR